MGRYDDGWTHEELSHEYDEYAGRHTQRYSYVVFEDSRPAIFSVWQDNETGEYDITGIKYIYNLPEGNPLYLRDPFTVVDENGDVVFELKDPEAIALVTANVMIYVYKEPELPF